MPAHVEEEALRRLVGAGKAASLVGLGTGNTGEKRQPTADAKGKARACVTKLGEKARAMSMRSQSLCLRCTRRVATPRPVGLRAKSSVSACLDALIDA